MIDYSVDRKQMIGCFRSEATDRKATDQKRPIGSVPSETDRSEASDRKCGGYHGDDNNALKPPRSRSRGERGGGFWEGQSFFLFLFFLKKRSEVDRSLNRRASPAAGGATRCRRRGNRGRRRWRQGEEPHPPPRAKPCCSRWAGPAGGAFNKTRTSSGGPVRVLRWAGPLQTEALEGGVGVVGGGGPDARLRFKSLCRGPARGGGALLCFVAVQVFEGLELLDERLVLVLQHGHAVLQTLDVLLLLPAALPGSLPGGGGGGEKTLLATETCNK